MMMVMCTMDSFIPRPPPINGLLNITGGKLAETKRSTASSGFRLLPDTSNAAQQQQDETGSVYSIYKQKIDAMFESDSTSSTKNSVQARIEKMFTDVAIDSGMPVSDYGCHHFSVDYLGAVPLGEKVTSLAGLQAPLKELYFAYKKSVTVKQPLGGRLEISAMGLRVQYQGEKGDLEQINSFPTIAVWSAVKFVLQDDNRSYAFLPLITDPDNIDKQQLFRNLDSLEKQYIGAASHSPLFAVVMRKVGAHKQLECHGFVCQTSEDAIVIAATLYKSLMAHMKVKERKPKNRNGVTCMSVASTLNDTGSVPVRPPRKKRSSTSSIVSDIETIDTDTAPLLHDENKQPRKSTKARRAPKAPPKQRCDDLDAITTCDEPTSDVKDPKLPLGDKWNTYKSNTQKQITAEIKQVMSESSNMGLKRVKSLRKRAEEIKAADNNGDILTKVTIPRSGSFLNAGGLTRYKSKVQKLNGQATGGSPLGFNELFNEFRLQEGLHSMDEILGVIIDPEGMSFNDLKPIYKEFLLKLSVTLTKDELYQRSKSIMRRHKKKLLRRNSSMRPKKPSVLVCSKFKRLKHVFQRLRAPKTHAKLEERNVAAHNGSKLAAESTISSSSYDTQHFTPKKELVARKQSYRRREATRRDRQSTSEESDFFSLRKAKTHSSATPGGGAQHNRNSSSGYVSCSECSFDSDTCTCASADRCYCSLAKHSKPRCYCDAARGHGDESLTFCGCDTDSCADSNKCYCTKVKTPKGTIFEQLRQRGFIPSSESATTPPLNRKLCKKNSNTKSTKSLEYMHNPVEKYYEKVRPKSRKGSGSFEHHYSLEYNHYNDNSKSIYMKSATESSAHLCNRPNERGRQRHHSEALAVKKSAEIAALFSDIKLHQTPLQPRNSAELRSRFPSQRMIANTLYGSSRNHMYSTKNGLYTIQSQSDDSSRGKKSSSEQQRPRTAADHYFKSNKLPLATSSSLENSLGYLP